MTFDLDLVTKLGAVWGAVQAVALAVQHLAPSHTVVFRVAKWLTSGLPRPAAPQA